MLEPAAHRVVDVAKIFEWMSNYNSIEILASIQQYIHACEKEIPNISIERKELLSTLAMHIQQQLTKESTISLTFICTHNSRRSHFAQIWAQIAAAYFGINHVKCYSGGTEITAFNPNAVKTLQTAGLVITGSSTASNPHYLVRYSEAAPTIVAFSKKYADTPNPTTNYTAILTCSEADEACPIVIGANERFKITFEDPKKSDGTPNQEKVYVERCKQIATEMLYLFQLVVTS